MSVFTAKKNGIVLVHAAAAVAMVLVVAACDWLFQPSMTSHATVRGMSAIAVVTYVTVYHWLTPPSAA